MTGPAVAAVPLVLFGATGLLAGEFLRLLEGHRGLRLVAASSRRDVDLAAAHPHLAAAGAPALVDPDAAAATVARLAAVGEVAVVLALAHGESAALWSSLRRRLGADAEHVVLVDLAADHRLRDPALYAATYGAAHPDPAALQDFVYGLPEFHRAALGDARRAAAAGCFATALQLAALPAARAGLLDPERPWIFAGVTGSSGAGNAPVPGTHHPHRHGNLRAYGLAGHRHEAELAQALASAGIAPPLHFLPHSGPYARGIHLSAFLPLARPADAGDAGALYRAAYADEPFVAVLGEGAPELRAVVGSNRATLAVHRRRDVLNVLLALDNVVKGGAGQALQCLNLMLGRDETEGLPRAGLGVC